MPESMMFETPVKTSSWAVQADPMLGWDMLFLYAITAFYCMLLWAFIRVMSDA